MSALEVVLIEFGALDAAIESVQRSPNEVMKTLLEGAKVE